MGANVLIIDEAAHISEQLFFKTLVPILSMRYTSLLALSSPEGTENYFSRMLTLKNKEDDSDFFQRVDCYQICNACLRLPDRAEQIKCTHVKNSAHWLSQASMRKLRALYEANPEDAIREFGGVSVSDHKPVIDQQHMHRFVTKQRWLQRSPPRRVFICVDPNGGGNSHMAIVSGFYASPSELVVSFFQIIEM